MAKKMVVKVDLQDDKAKQKAMKTVSTLSGIDSIAMDMKEKKLTVIGAVDPINVVTKLRKHWPATDILLVGPAKEPEKPADKKDEGGKPADDGKKEEPKKEGGAGEAKKEEKKEAGEPKKDAGGAGDDYQGEETAAPEYDPAVMEMVKAYKAYYPINMETYHVESTEENPSACAIC